MAKEDTKFGWREGLVAFAFGAVGGAAPNLLRLAGLAQADQMPAGGYFVALAIFAFLGGVVAVSYHELVSHKAFFLGIGAPALIFAGGTAVEQQQTANAENGRPNTWNFDFVSEALAQEEPLADVPGATPDPLRQAAPTESRVRFVIVPLLGDPESQPYSVRAITAEGLQTVDLSSPEETGEPLPLELPDDLPQPFLLGHLPPDAVAIVVERIAEKDAAATSVGRIVSPKAPDEVILEEEVRIERPPTFWDGFREGVGIQKSRSGRLRQIEPATAK